MTKGKVLLAYSGGLDTSCILAWLIEQGYEVQCYMANIGQEEDFEAAREKALKIGATAVYIEDIRPNCLYEGVYLLGTSLARPVIAAKQMEIAKREGCQFVFTVVPLSMLLIQRFKLLLHGEFQNSTTDSKVVVIYLLTPAEKGIPVQQTAAKPWSTDENLYHISYEAGILEDPNVTPPVDMWKLTTNPEKAPDTPEHLAITFKAGIPVKVENLGDGHVETDPLDLFLYLNHLGRKHGVGRVDIVENRFIGIKSRGCYETPGGTILRAAHVDLEGLAMDREARRLRDSLGVRLSEILYNGYWFTAEREIIQAAVTESQKYIDGTVRVKLYKGSVTMEGRTSPNSLYDQDLSSMDIAGGFHPLDSEGFIKIQSIRLKAYTDMKSRLGKN
ncbi:argininosuccinate synthase [Anaeromyces robustus]|uniref:Argininosuccinate synthase n=1 Tax=Anaeromyces robustus TaxID=1754192 RepID=A0A1Y1WBV6_9FUNG|nr:argininosuccinate synthase [Anaeromyces robustus]|eukprot:ORX71031.1 argininosuccinate synthase [Anaeromyces robustus]